jgi:hypothetical protein
MGSGPHDEGSFGGGSDFKMGSGMASPIEPWKVSTGYPFPGDRFTMNSELWGMYVGFAQEFNRLTGPQKDAVRQNLDQLAPYAEILPWDTSGTTVGNQQNFFLILMKGLVKMAELDDQAMANIGAATAETVQRYGQWLTQQKDLAAEQFNKAIQEYAKDDKKSSQMQGVSTQLNSLITNYQQQTGTIQSLGSSFSTTASGLTSQQQASAQGFSQALQIMQQVFQGLSRSFQ